MGENLITPNVRNCVTIVIMAAIGYCLLMLVHKGVSNKMAANSAAA